MIASMKTVCVIHSVCVISVLFCLPLFRTGNTHGTTVTLCIIILSCITSLVQCTSPIGDVE